MNYTIDTEINEVDHIKPFEVKVKIDITDDKLWKILKSINELHESERYALVYWEIMPPILPKTFKFNVEKLSQTVLHPNKRCTSFIEIPDLLDYGVKINLTNRKQANKVESEIKYSLTSFLKRIEKKYKIAR